MFAAVQAHIYLKRDGKRFHTSAQAGWQSNLFGCVGFSPRDGFQVGMKQARPCLFPATYGRIRREEKRSSAVNVIITVNKSKSVLGCEFADGEITGASSSFLFFCAVCFKSCSKGTVVYPIITNRRTHCLTGKNTIFAQVWKPGALYL